MHISPDVCAKTLGPGREDIDIVGIVRIGAVAPVSLLFPPLGAKEHGGP